MRTHRRHPAFTHFAQWSHGRVSLNAQTLTVARIEPIDERADEPAAMDLVFFDGENVAVVPRIEIVPEMLEYPELSALVWPAAYAHCVSHEQAAALEAALLPWIQARRLDEEAVRFFRGDGAALFERARRNRFLGAAAYRLVCEDAAAYMHAARFATDRRVGIADENGACGALMLARHAAHVRADLGDPQRNALAARWYATAIFSPLEGEYDVAIGADAGPAGIRVELDAVRRSFHVECSVRRTVRPAFAIDVRAHGGSSGRIAIALRDDWQAAPDADSDDAQTLAGRLREEGFTVDVCFASACDPGAYDLVHAFTLAVPQGLAALSARARAADTALVVTAGLPDVVAQSSWQAAISTAAIERAEDEISIEDRLAAPQSHGEPFAGYERSLREVLARADAVITAGTDEAQLVRSCGFNGPVLHAPAYLERSAAPACIERLVGTSDFVLAHAPVEPRANQFLLVRAAAQAGLPLVIAGPVRDERYRRHLAAFADERTLFVPEPDPAVRAALYRSARVFADVGYVRFGLRRIAEAIASGCAAAISSGYACQWGAGTWQADPRDTASIAIALGDAWMAAGERPRALAECARRVLASCDPRAALATTVRAYAAASQARVGA